MKSRIQKGFWLLEKPCAHRGYFDNNNGIPENSSAAYERAIEKNYPIEMDIQLSKDGKLVCFHDDNLIRMTGVDSLIWDKTLDEIKSLRLLNTDEVIMTFEEFLSLVDGKVPLLIEIKHQREKGIEEKVINALKGYTGEYVIQSFDPLIMIKIKKLAPDVIRGQLACANPGQNSKFKNNILRKCGLNFLVKPDFINYCLNDLPTKYSVGKNIPLLCWTIRDEQDKQKAEKYAVSYVFENLDL